MRAAALRRDAYVTPRSPSARHVRRGPAPIRATWRARSPRGRGERKPSSRPRRTSRGGSAIRFAVGPRRPASLDPVHEVRLTVAGPRSCLPAHGPCPRGTRHAPHAVGTAPWSPHVRPGSVPTFLRPHSLPPRPHSLLEGSWTHASAAGGRRRCPPSWPTERQPLSERSGLFLYYYYFA